MRSFITSVIACAALGDAHLYRGIYESCHGGQGAPWWNRAIDESGKALMLRPKHPEANHTIGEAHRWLRKRLETAVCEPRP